MPRSRGAALPKPPSREFRLLGNVRRALKLDPAEPSGQPSRRRSSEQTAPFRSRARKELPARLLQYPLNRHSSVSPGLICRSAMAPRRRRRHRSPISVYQKDRIWRSIRRIGKTPRLPLCDEQLVEMGNRTSRVVEGPPRLRGAIGPTRCVKLTPGVYYLPMCGGVSIMARSRQITTKTPSPAATIIISTSLCLSAKQFNCLSESLNNSGLTCPAQASAPRKTHPGGVH